MEASHSRSKLSPSHPHPTARANPSAENSHPHIPRANSNPATRIPQLTLIPSPENSHCWNHTRHLSPSVSGGARHTWKETARIVSTKRAGPGPRLRPTQIPENIARSRTILLVSALHVRMYTLGLYAKAFIVNHWFYTAWQPNFSSGFARMCPQHVLEYSFIVWVPTVS